MVLELEAGSVMLPCYSFVSTFDCLNVHRLVMEEIKVLRLTSNECIIKFYIHEQ
jgi:hypothetical protein